MPAEDKEYKLPKEVRAYTAKANLKRRQDRDIVLVEIPRAYRDWFKVHAAQDGTSLIVAINAALEMFMEEEEARTKG